MPVTSAECIQTVILLPPIELQQRAQQGLARRCPRRCSFLYIDQLQALGLGAGRSEQAEPKCCFCGVRI